MVRANHAGRHGLCDIRRLDRAMDMDNDEFNDDADFELDAELETWDWVRTAGVSADDLRETLEGLRPGFDFRKAA